MEYKKKKKEGSIKSWLLSLSQRTKTRDINLNPTVDSTRKRRDDEVEIRRRRLHSDLKY
jgi:hypothetical protein